MRIRFTLLFTLLGVSAAFLSLRCGDAADGRDSATNSVHQNATDVKALTVQPQTFVDYIELTGSVKADVTTVISAEESGSVKTILRDKGEHVKRGDIVLVLNSSVLQASYDEARAAYLLSEATFKRQANLYKDNVISEQKYLEFKYNLARDRARHENLSARLAKTKIKSPVTGIIDDKFVEVGEFVMPGTRLVRIVKTDVVKIAAGAPERFVQDVSLGAQTEITIDVLTDRTFNGPVTFVGPSINKQTRTFPIEIQLDNADGQLKPEMFARIKIRKVEVPDAVVIPRDAIIETEKGKFIFVANSSVAVRRQIQIGGANDNKVWVKIGLRPGEKIIVVGHRDLVDGDRIVIHN